LPNSAGDKSRPCDHGPAPPFSDAATEHVCARPCSPAGADAVPSGFELCYGISRNWASISRIRLRLKAFSPLAEPYQANGLIATSWHWRRIVTSACPRSIISCLRRTLIGRKPDTNNPVPRPAARSSYRGLRFLFLGSPPSPRLLPVETPSIPFIACLFQALIIV
jgi:hypothetical protein